MCLSALRFICTREIYQAGSDTFPKKAVDLCGLRRELFLQGREVRLDRHPRGRITLPWRRSFYQPDINSREVWIEVIDRLRFLVATSGSLRRGFQIPLKSQRRKRCEFRKCRFSRSGFRGALALEPALSIGQQPVRRRRGV